MSEPKRKPHRDEETGEITINGKWGTAFAWLKFANQWATLPLLLVIGSYALTHRDDHQDFRAFMDEGGRQSRDMAEKDHSELRLEFETGMNKLPRPPKDFRREFDVLAEEVAKIRDDQAAHIGEFREFRGEMSSAIARLLKD